MAFQETHSCACYCNHVLHIFHVLANLNQGNGQLEYAKNLNVLATQKKPFYSLNPEWHSKQPCTHRGSHPTLYGSIKVRSSWNKRVLDDIYSYFTNRNNVIESRIRTQDYTVTFYETRFHLYVDKGYYELNTDHEL